MGQQQLFLITLGVIVVSAALIVGIDYFVADAIESNRDAVIIDLHTIANSARAYYKNDQTYGGGGRSFENFQIPKKLEENNNGSYEILYATQSQLLLQGVGVEKTDLGFGCDEQTPITYQLLVRPEEVILNKLF